MPLDSGLRLVGQRDQAQLDLLALQPQLQLRQARADEVQRHWNELTGRLEALDARSRETAAQLDATRNHLRAAAADAYIYSGSGRIDAAISSITDARSAIDVGRDLHIIGVYGRREKTALDRYLALKKKVDRQIRDLSEERAKVGDELERAQGELEDAQAAVADAQKRLAEALFGIEKFHQQATSASSPILGPSRLTAKQLADFIKAGPFRPRITVTIDELAKYYIEEGDKAAVRGDVAFAQSILETAGFNFPDYGQVAVGDNNFAGIGACDTCDHGFRFPDARTGVRAQMQALRIYVDPKLKADSLADPLVMPKMLGLGFRGKVQTWWDLWGTWATGAFYGQRVYDIYEQIVAFAATDPPV